MLADQRVRMRAAHERGMQQAGQRDVVDEAALAAQQRLVLERDLIAGEPDQGSMPLVRGILYLLA